LFYKFNAELLTQSAMQPRPAFLPITKQRLISKLRACFMFTVPDAVIVPHIKFSSLVCSGRETQEFFAAPLASPPGLL
jgi:hypothetical protein